MQTITDRTEELAREAAIRTWVALYNLPGALAQRAREQRGQTAAEYMGILLIVALIIGALVGLDVDGKIARAADTLIGNIKEGNKTDN
jgi:Flp pilus assembly pilin Flp